MLHYVTYEIMYLIFQAVEYGTYASTFTDPQNSQLSSAYYGQNYSSYSPASSSSNACTNTYQLTTSSVLGEFISFNVPVAM